MSESELTLCKDCSKEENLIKFVESNGAPGICTLCGMKRKLVVSAKELTNIFKALIRYYYSELEYNPHWGGDDVWRLFRKPNPIIHSDKIGQIQSSDCPLLNDEIDLSIYIEEIVDPVYPPSEKEGVFLYWGHTIEGYRNYYHDTLEEKRSSELDDLAEKLQFTNYYELEKEWLNRLSHHGNEISIIQPAGKEYYRARIGVDIEATKISDLDQNNEKVVFPYSGKAISAPPQKSIIAGRLNRANISYLYLADSLDTAVAEVRPHPGHIVSVGRFSSTCDLRIANLAGIQLLPFSNSEEDLEAFILLRNIEREFSTPVLPEDKIGYLMTQFLSDIFRMQGYNGVTYRSSVVDGVNLLAFNPSCFSYVSDSQDARYIHSLKYDLRRIAVEFKKSYNPEATYISNGKVLRAKKLNE